MSQNWSVLVKHPTEQFTIGLFLFSKTVRKKERKKEINEVYTEINLVTTINTVYSHKCMVNYWPTIDLTL